VRVVDDSQVPVDADIDGAALALLEISRVLMGITLRAVASSPVPLTVPQHRLLVVISVRGPQRIGALAADLGVNQSNASRLVDRLVDQGLLARATDPEDGRASLVSLTEAGVAAYDGINDLRLEQLRELVQDLSPTGRRGLASGLRRLQGHQV
jgi:DNA-binding MarR family transcriptional regulator